MLSLSLLCLFSWLLLLCPSSCACILLQYVKPPFILDLERRNKSEIKKMGNGGTSASTQGGATNALKPASAAQALLAEAKSNAASSDRGDAGEFAGLKGLKGLANKDADCKQQ